jgi:hypothetical protein
MKRKRYSERNIMSTLKEHEAGASLTKRERAFLFVLVGRCGPYKV